MTNAILNPFRQRLLQHEKLIGCWCMLANPVTTEILGLAGFDWLLLDGEHAPNDINSFMLQLMALKGSNSAAFVRPSSNNEVTIKGLLDIGFYNLLIPCVEDVQQANDAVAATRYPPKGIRGVSVSHRGNIFGTIENYFREINENITVVVQIENIKGMENIDSIAASEGVDGIFVGPGDLSAALGHPGRPDHPEVQHIISHIFSRAKAKGKPCGILAPVLSQAQTYLQNGATFVAVGSDLSIFQTATNSVKETFSAALR